MIKKFDMVANPILSSVIDRLDAFFPCPKFRQMKDKIAIHTLDDLVFHIDENRQTVERGFGACSVRDFGSAGISIAIVINKTNCQAANLTEREIAAVVLHELGHILNEPDLEPEPTFEFCCFIHNIPFNREGLDSVQVMNGLKREIFADSYANQYGYGQELLATLDKQNEFFEQRIGYYADRVDMLRGGTYFEGRIMIQTARPWA